METRKRDAMRVTRLALGILFICHSEMDRAKRTPVQQAEAGSREYLPAQHFFRHASDLGAPQHLGHSDSPVCFLCHDGNHTSEDRQAITNDCSACHQIPASGERTS
jgi:hypothetical protein